MHNHPTNIQISIPKQVNSQSTRIWTNQCVARGIPRQILVTYIYSELMDISEFEKLQILMDEADSLFNTMVERNLQGIDMKSLEKSR